VAVALVTGASGFAGGHLIRQLLADGVVVVGTTLGNDPEAHSILERGERDAVRWVELDVTDRDQVGSVIEEASPGQIYHLAGQASVGSSFRDVAGTWAANATGTLNVVHAAAARAPAARVLVVSSSEVYGNVPEAEQPIREDRPVAPVNPYGASKAAAEIAAAQVARTSGLHVVVARSFNHTGPGQSTRFALPNWAAQLRRIAAGLDEPVIRVGNLEARRDVLDVRDVVSAYRLLIDRGERTGFYNVASGSARVLREVVETLVEISGTGARIEVEPERLRPVDLPLLAGDASRLRGLGWSPAIDLRGTLSDLLASAGHAA
jgi:GDP-4-dehydro-6-deoxy-D-mannose reductase